MAWFLRNVSPVAQDAPLTHDPPPCQGELLGNACDEPPVHTCRTCRTSLCEFHTFPADLSTYCYSCLYEKKCQRCNTVAPLTSVETRDAPRQRLCEACKTLVLHPPRPPRRTFWS